MKEAVNSKTGKLRLSNLRNEGKGMKKNEQSFRGWWDSIKCITKCTMGVSEGRKERKGQKGHFKNITPKNIPNLMKNVNLHTQEGQTTLSG